MPPGPRRLRAASLLLATLRCGLAGPPVIADARPPPARRTFNSSLVNHVVDVVGRSILPRELGTLFSNCLPNTLDTTVLHAGPSRTLVGSAPDSFVVTGDIPAMWLRDSMNQVQPYIALLNASLAAGREDPALEDLLFGVLHRHITSVLVDVYANAFAWWGPKGKTGVNRDDVTFREFEPGGGAESAMEDPRIFERKFEVDSLLSVLKLTSDLAELRPGRAAERLLEDPSFVPAIRSVLETLREMTRCGSRAYTFQRKSLEPIDSLLHGVGSPCRDTGMVRTHFRPSDDAATFAFNVPGNAMAAVELGRLRAVLARLQTARSREQGRPPSWAAGLPELEREAARLEASVRRGLAEHGTMTFRGETVYAYEVDGFGNAIFMDDANVPSLLSLPMLGFVEASDPVYRATRRLVLSEHNPWYFRGRLGVGGVGGPHVGAGMIWPMSLMVQAWTSTDVQEVGLLLRQLAAVSVNGLMHESFHEDNSSTFTRPLFAWANTLFGGLLLRVASDGRLCRAAGLQRPLDLVALIRRWAEGGRAFVV